MQQFHSLLDIELYNSQKAENLGHIKTNNSVNISTTSQATNLILIGHRALKKTSVMVQKDQKSPKVDIVPDNSQPTICSSSLSLSFESLDSILISNFPYYFQYGRPTRYYNHRYHKPL